ncbi:MAG: GntR family transcriptional regulator [Acidobacteriota bacterium]
MDVRNSPRTRGASISFRAAEVIREAIFTGRLLPGDPLLESQLMQDLRVSQTSVREALLSLEREGLVVRIPNRGTSVVQLTDEALQERASVYALLESAAAVEAAGRISQAEAEQLEGCARALDERSQLDTPQSFRKADLAFHRLLWRYAGNSVLYGVLDSLTVPMFALGQLLPPAATLKDAPGCDHRAIVRAVKANDRKEIARVISEHVSRSFLNAKTCGAIVRPLLLPVQ